ncbi:MAG: alpha/beta fold hydrolase, partial [Myxococcaceae bacterium]
MKVWYATWGESGPWIAFAPIFQIVHSQMLKTTVPYLSHHFRVVTMDCRGNGRSDRPGEQAAYSLDAYYEDFVAVLDALGVERVAVIGISATAMTALRLAAEQPERITHLVIAGGFAESLVDDPKVAERVRADLACLRSNWPEHLHQFFSSVFTEPHSTKPFEDGVRYGWATTGPVLERARQGWRDNDVRELARSIRCPTLVIHGDGDKRAACRYGKEIHELVPG